MFYQYSPKYYHSIQDHPPHSHNENFVCEPSTPTAYLLKAAAEKNTGVVV
jgi:hypothetical protein